MSRVKTAVRALPFSDDYALDLLDRGIDIEQEAARWYRAEDKKKNRMAEAIFYALNNPVAGFTEKEAGVLAGKRAKSNLGKCGSKAVYGADDVGHFYAKRIYCGQEWCPRCGEDGSDSHSRRIMSWLPKIEQVLHLGYFVIEAPIKDRLKWHSRKSLEDAGKIIVSVLKGEYEIASRRRAGEILPKGECKRIRARWFDRGLRRWHYFGDVEDIVSDIMPSFPDFDNGTVKYNPHLNVLVDAGYITPERLDVIKSQLKQALGLSDLIVHYSYVEIPGQMIQKIKYVTRSTFKRIEWDEFLAGSLYGFRNMHSWGNWKQEAAWHHNTDAPGELEGINVEAVQSIGQSLCPIDGLPLYWSRPASAAIIDRLTELHPEQVTDYGAGYYRLPDLTVPLWDSFVTDNMREIEDINLFLAREHRKEELASMNDYAIDISAGARSTNSVPSAAADVTQSSFVTFAENNKTVTGCTMQPVNNLESNDSRFVENSQKTIWG